MKTSTKDAIFKALVVVAVLLIIIYAWQVVVSVNASENHAVLLPASDGEVQEDYYYLLPTVWETEAAETTEPAEETQAAVPLNNQK